MPKLFRSIGSSAYAGKSSKTLPISTLAAVEHSYAHKTIQLRRFLQTRKARRTWRVRIRPHFLWICSKKVWHAQFLPYGGNSPNFLTLISKRPSVKRSPTLARKNLSKTKVPSVSTSCHCTEKSHARQWTRPKAWTRPLYQGSTHKTRRCRVNWQDTGRKPLARRIETRM